MQDQSPWYLSPWRLNLAIAGAAAVWMLVLGNPLEPLEMRWFDQLLRWRASAGWARPADERILHVDIGDEDLIGTRDRAGEYQEAARIIRECGELGAALVVCDIIWLQGSESESQPLLQAIKEQKTVLAEGLLPTKSSSSRLEILRSFPFLEITDHPSPPQEGGRQGDLARDQPAGLINGQAFLCL